MDHFYLKQKLNNYLDKCFRKLESDIPTEEAYDKNGNKLKNWFVGLLASIPTEQFYEQNGNKFDGIYAKGDPENTPFDIYDNFGNKLGKYIRALLGQEGIDGYDKKDIQLERKYCKYDTDGPIEDLYDSDGNKLDGT